ncbi:heme-binding protein [Flavobacteriales bacterium]|mgnify:CR=1 FL=1|nr:heme-binding protein [Flavobacteriales bacterium]|tara:strand:- start:1408 stop:1983 length:576 start_codon:yes stop_codon:yes gene_type:complete
MKKALLIMIMIAFSLLIYSFKNNTSNSVQEQYIILKKIDNIEIRKYRESVNASYYSKGKEERNNYFKNLAAYIFGDNNKNISIAMTSPVTMKLYGNKEMIFRMPNNYTLDSLPKANNPKINFMTIASCTKAAIQYSGYSNKNIEENKIKELKNILERENINHNNKFELLVYNSPFEILNRRNEITINIIYP